MKKFSGYVVLTEAELNNKCYEKFNKLRDQVIEDFEEKFKERLQEKDKAIKKLNKTVARLEVDAIDAQDDFNRQFDRQETINKKELKTHKQRIADLQDEIDVLNDERDEVRAVAKMSMDNDDKEVLLNQRKESLDKTESTLKDRESKLVSKEEGRYKEGYADGVADGVRKISEITQKDRDNTMKIAMVAASSHTPVANMKEALSAGNQLTEGTTNTES